MHLSRLRADECKIRALNKLQCRLFIGMHFAQRLIDRDHGFNASRRGHVTEDKSVNGDNGKRARNQMHWCGLFFELSIQTESCNEKT